MQARWDSDDDLVGSSHWQDKGERPRRAHRALVLGALVGALVGGLAVQWWHQAGGGVPDDTTVSVALVDVSGGPSTFLAAVEVRNLGDGRVEVEDAEFSVDGFDTTLGTVGDLTVRAGGRRLLQFVLAPRCQSIPDDEVANVRLAVRSQAGTPRDLSFSVLADPGPADQLWDLACWGSAIDVPVQLTTTAAAYTGPLSLRLLLSVDEQVAEPDLTPRAVSMRGPTALGAAIPGIDWRTDYLDDRHNLTAEPATAGVTLEVTDCAAADGLNAESLDVFAEVESGQVRAIASVPPDVDLALAVQRYVAIACGPPAR